MVNSIVKDLLDVIKYFIGFFIFIFSFIILHEISHIIGCYFFNVEMISIVIKYNKRLIIGIAITEKNPIKMRNVALCGSIGACLTLLLVNIYSMIKKKYITSLYTTFSFLLELMNWFIGVNGNRGDSKILITYGFRFLAELMLFSVFILCVISIILFIYSFKGLKY